MAHPEMLLDFLIEIEERMKRQTPTSSDFWYEFYLACVQGRKGHLPRWIYLFPSEITAREQWATEYNLLAELTRPEGCEADYWHYV
jgi:hypothetical protein